MYGLVNRALEELVRKQHGDQAWEDILEASRSDTEFFITMESYPDELSYALIGAATERLGIPADQVLYDFGRHWVLETAAKGYGAMLDAAGRTLPEFLKNLPNFHTRVCMLFPDLRPPQFEVRDEQERSLTLRYRSHRFGFTPFVLGLLDGLGERFGVLVSATHEPLAAESGVIVDFFLTWEPRP